MENNFINIIIPHKTWEWAWTGQWVAHKLKYKWTNLNVKHHPVPRTNNILWYVTELMHLINTKAPIKDQNCKDHLYNHHSFPKLLCFISTSSGAPPADLQPLPLARILWPNIELVDCVWNIFKEQRKWKILLLCHCTSVQLIYEQDKLLIQTRRHSFRSFALPFYLIGCSFSPVFVLVTN